MVQGRWREVVQRCRSLTAADTAAALTASSYHVLGLAKLKMYAEAAAELAKLGDLDDPTWAGGKSHGGEGSRGLAARRAARPPARPPAARQKWASLLPQPALLCTRSQCMYCQRVLCLRPPLLCRRRLAGALCAALAGGGATWAGGAAAGLAGPALLAAGLVQAAAGGTGSSGR